METNTEDVVDTKNQDKNIGDVVDMKDQGNNVSADYLINFLKEFKFMVDKETCPLNEDHGKTTIIELAKDLFSSENNESENCNKKSKLDSLIELIIGTINTSPDNYPNFVYQGLTDLICNDKKDLIKNNYKQNVLKMIELLKKVKSEEDKELNLFYNCLSSIVAAFIGDSMGSFVEFQNANENNWKKVWTEKNVICGTARGQVTDDSEMAMSSLLALNDMTGKGNAQNFNKDLLAFYYGIWYLSKPFDIGNTTKNGLYHFKHTNLLYTSIAKETIFGRTFFGKCSKQSESLNQNSLSNGFLMRRSPFSIYLYCRFRAEIDECFKNDNLESLFDLFEREKNVFSSDVKITHCNSETIYFSFFYDFLIFNILHLKLKGENKLTAIQVYERIPLVIKFIESKLEKKDYKCAEELLSFLTELDENSQNLDKAKDFIKKQEVDCCIGYFLHAIKLCCYVLKCYHLYEQKYNQKTFEQLMFLICNLGGDTDTNCCIVGGVLGPLVGIEGIGTAYEGRDYLVETMSFITLSGDGVERPFIYSPGLCMFILYELMCKINGKRISEEFDFSGIEVKDDKFSSLNVMLQVLLKKF